MSKAFPEMRNMVQRDSHRERSSPADQVTGLFPATEAGSVSTDFAKLSTGLPERTGPNEAQQN
jgi:hypothetical protein